MSGGASALAPLLARRSADEMVTALGLTNAPPLVRDAARALFLRASTPLGSALARFDDRIARIGIASAADAALVDLEARWSRDGAAPETGPLLVVANHPGAYDALALFAAIGRRDVSILAADREFLRALPELSRKLLFLPDAATDATATRARGDGLLRACRRLMRGEAVLHFGAGKIEADPDFPASPGAPVLDPWTRGTGALVRAAARAGGSVSIAIVRGVHSPRVKRLFVTRLAERRGWTTLAPLLQVAVPAFHDVAAHVRLSTPLDATALSEGADDAEIAARAREIAASLVRRGR